MPSADPPRKLHLPIGRSERKTSTSRQASRSTSSSLRATSSGFLGQVVPSPTYDGRTLVERSLSKPSPLYTRLLHRTRLIVALVWVVGVSYVSLHFWHASFDTEVVSKSLITSARTQSWSRSNRTQADRVALTRPQVLQPGDVRESDRNADFVRTIPITIADDPRYEGLFDGARQMRKKLHDFVWQGKNLCYDADHEAFFTSGWYPGPGTQRGGPSQLPFPHGQVRDLPKSDVNRWIKGMTIISMNNTLSQTGAHFYFWSMPAFHMVSFARNTLGRKDVNVVFDSLTIDEKHDLEKEILEIEFKDVPHANRFSRLDDLNKGITCFEEVIVNERLANPSAKMTAYPPDLKYIRRNAETVTKTRLVDHCSDQDEAAHKTIWLAQRRVFSRKIENIDPLKEMIQKVFGSDWKVVEFDSVNAPCKVDSKQCYGHYSCEEASKLGSPECLPKKSLQREIELFNNITFFISVHGATAMNLVWMPDQSHFVEVIPVGVTEPCYLEYSRRSGIEYFPFQEPNRTMYDTKFKHLDPANCFGNTECRWQTKGWPVHVSVDALEKTLREAKASYEKVCKKQN